MLKNKIFNDIINKFNLMELESKFIPESDEGYIEYKLRLDYIDNGKINRLSSQMKYRINEGIILNNEPIALYILGIDDRGNPGINMNVLSKTIDIISLVAQNCNAIITHQEIYEMCKINKYMIAMVYIKQCKKEIHINEFRIAMMGASNHGKTTCVSYMTYNEKDNGSGLSRMTIFKHAHEQTSGMTSSIKHDIFGLTNDTIQNYKSKDATWNKIAEKSDMVVSLFDLPGSLKYYRTTYYGISSLNCDMNAIIISIYDCMSDGFLDIPHQTLWYIKLSIEFMIPFIIIITKIDLIGNDESKIDEMIIYLNNFIDKIRPNTKVQFISVSNITGKNYDKLIDIIKSNAYKTKNKRYDAKTKDFLIYDVICSKDIGQIVSGISLGNDIKINEKLYIGPYENKFYPITIKSIRKKLIETDTIYNYESGSLEIIADNNELTIDKHMTIMDADTINNLKKYVHISTKYIDKIKENYRYVLYVDNIIELTKVNKIDSQNNIVVLEMNEKMIYIRENSNCILKNDTTNELGYFGKII